MIYQLSYQVLLRRKQDFCCCSFLTIKNNLAKPHIMDSPVCPRNIMLFDNKYWLSLYLVIS